MRNGGQKARSTGENAKQPFQPLRGECRDVSAELVVPAASIFSAGGPWARPAPGIPRALCLRGHVHRQSSDAKARRENAGACRMLRCRPGLEPGPIATARYCSSECRPHGPKKESAVWVPAQGRDDSRVGERAMTRKMPMRRGARANLTSPAAGLRSEVNYDPALTPQPRCARRR